MTLGTGVLYVDFKSCGSFTAKEHFSALGIIQHYAEFACQHIAADVLPNMIINAS